MIFILQAPSLDPSKLIPVLIAWILIMGISLFLIVKQKLKKSISLVILGVSFVGTGLIFAATPNPVMPIQNILVGVNLSAPLQQMLPMVIMLIGLILITLVFGRILCGYACPLGAIQELFSKIYFKSKLSSKSSKKTITLDGKISKVVRFVYFVMFISFSLIWGGAVAQYLNIFVGFHIFNNPVFPMIGIPAIFLAIIIVSSIFVYRPWCRLFCPYGTISGFSSKFSLFKLRRTDECTDCKLCEKICPTQEAFRDSEKGECYLCNRCVDICPQNAIEFTRK